MQAAAARAAAAAAERAAALAAARAAVLLAEYVAAARWCWCWFLMSPRKKKSSLMPCWWQHWKKIRGQLPFLARMPLKIPWPTLKREQMGCQEKQGEWALLGEKMGCHCRHRHWQHHQMGCRCERWAQRPRRSQTRPLSMQRACPQWRSRPPSQASPQKQTPTNSSLMSRASWPKGGHSGDVPHLKGLGRELK